VRRRDPALAVRGCCRHADLYNELFKIRTEYKKKYDRAFNYKKAVSDFDVDSIFASTAAETLTVGSMLLIVVTRWRWAS
jgi:hypothetical protein